MIVKKTKTDKIVFVVEWWVHCLLFQVKARPQGNYLAIQLLWRDLIVTHVSLIYLVDEFFLFLV